MLMRSRLRIAFVVHDYNRVHGHSRYVAELAERFAADHEVHVFANRFENLPAGIVPHQVPALRFSALATIFSFIVPASLMVGRGFDIVHAQGLTMFGPDVVTAHISNAKWLEGRRQVEGENLSWRERLFAALVVPAERRSLRDGRATAIAISSALRDDLASGYGRSARTVVIPHGVDGREFHPGVRTGFRAGVRRELGLDDDVPVFLFVGDLRKGMEPAIRGLAAVPHAHLVAVSRAPLDAYRAIASKCGVANRVTLLPATSQVQRYYGAADVLVLPTPYDAFGMVITEAMACGLPVITTVMAGAAELIIDGVHGKLLASAADLEGLSGAMRSLAEDPVSRRRMGEAAAALMREHTWDRVAERTLAVYYEHIGQKKLRTQNSELRTQNAERRTPTAERRPQNADLRTPNAEPQNAELRTQKSGFRTVNSRPSTGARSGSPRNPGGRMRVLVATQTRDRIGGVEAYLEAVLPALAARHEVAFFSASDEISGRGAIVLPSGVKRLTLEQQSDDRLRLLKAWRPDLVFAHGLEDPVLERDLLGLAPAVVVEHTYHGTCISSSKTMTLPAVSACTRALGPECLALYLPRGCGGRNPLTMVRLYRTQMERRDTIRHVAAVVTLSKHMADEMVRNGVGADRVHVVPPFVPIVAPSVDRPIDRPTDQPIDRPTDEPIRLLYLGRLEPLKGVDRLIDAMPIAATELGRAIDLVVAGDGAQRDALERRAAAVCATASRVRIEFPGWQDESGRAQRLAEADALVVPSLWPEPFGLVGLEAASAGVPAVAFATGGIPEWLQDDENGCLARPESASPFDLAVAIVRCVKDAGTLERLREGSRRSAARWTRQRHVEALERVFAGVAAPVAIGHAS